MRTLEREAAIWPACSSSVIDLASTAIQVGSGFDLAGSAITFSFCTFRRSESCPCRQWCTENALFGPFRGDEALGLERERHQCLPAGRSVRGCEIPHKPEILLARRGCRNRELICAFRAFPGLRSHHLKTNTEHPLRWDTRLSWSEQDRGKRRTFLPQPELSQGCKGVTCFP